jgi:hypothetical protein
MPRPEEKVHIPLDFKEAVSDLLKVKPEPKSKKQARRSKRKNVRSGKSA